MGSSGNQVVVQRVIEAFDNTHYQVISPVKAHIAGTRTIIPANVLVTDWLPAPKVNPLADIAVIHGGHGTVQTACASGTPFVGIGMQPEQEWNIDFLVRRGCAIRLSRHEVTRQDIIQAVEQLLNNQHAQAVAKEVQSEYQQWNGAERTAQFLASHFK
jgi:UDP:flavonoid glycosyltransferase YjiC (YdhE family)